MLAGMPGAWEVPMSIHRVARAVFGGVFLILPLSAFAQEIGVKAGVNFASLPPEEVREVDASLHADLLGERGERQDAGTPRRTPRGQLDK